MRTGGQHVLHRRQLLGDKAGNLAHGASLDDNGQIEAAAHQIHALHLMVRIDLTGDLIKAHTLLRGDLDLDECGYALLGCFIPIDHGLVAEDRRILLIRVDRSSHVLLGLTEHRGQLCRSQTRVLRQQIKQLFRVFHNK